MISLSAFMQGIQNNVARITHYENAGDGNGGGSDCIGLIIGAVRLAGGTWPGIHGSNWAARNVTDDLHAVSSASELLVGDIVYKAREPGQDKYKLPDTYKNDPDQRDYYHVGVVTSVSPFTVTHCTGVNGGIQRDHALGAWRYAGELSLVDYDDYSPEAPADPVLYRATITADNDFPVRLRSGPSIKYEILCQVDQGTVVDVLETGNGWSKIRVGSATGWMMNQFLRQQGGVLAATVTVNRADLEAALALIQSMLNQ